ncbi:hypothetical protein CISIN_1g034727mg [Citrus sinensis]|uniref:RNase H type-1 domain-containing protein n=1 Tax=Citrus sinensis TaxID=2711 RepID=A0A067D0A8_CITSI|nr:hypothetical protein CISIN_1g034727mg [Citrus sinensis]
MLRADDGSLIYNHNGVGITTNNVAKYGSLILGLKYALQKGFFNFRVRGDSKLVHMQVCCWLMEDQTPGMAELCGEAKRLKDKFLSI